MSTTEMTPTRMSTATADPIPAPRQTYGELWRRLPRELGFLLLTLPVIVTALTLLSTLFFMGVGMLAIFVGLFILVAALYVARGFGLFELARLRWAGQQPITPPQWRPTGEPSSTLRALLGPLVNGHYWLYLLHGMVVNFIIGLVSWTLTVIWAAMAFGGLTYWIWEGFDRESSGRIWISRIVIDWMFPRNTFVFDSLVAESLFFFVIGVLFALTLPLVTRGLVSMHQAVARGMLGAWRSEALSREVADLSESRGAAVAAEDHSLRRLERDIHDGPQQRLVRLQMDLASAERKLDSADPDAARQLLAEARVQTHETLEELRALSRGLVPPILQDRGLVAGLESLAARSTVPVALELAIDPTVELPQEIERSAYFVAAELLTNAAKHSGATGIRLHAATRRTPDGSAWLDIWVIDNGRGGAVLQSGHGLAGLNERLKGLRGILSVDSPIGGPTAVGAHIPLPAAAARRPAVS